MCPTTKANQIVIKNAKDAYQRRPIGPMVNPFVNIFEGWDVAKKRGFHDATMHDDLNDAAEDAIEPHYVGTVMFELVDGKLTVSMLDLSDYGNEQYEERQRDAAFECTHEAGLRSLEVAGRV